MQSASATNEDTAPGADKAAQRRQAHARRDALDPVYRAEAAMALAQSAAGLGLSGVQAVAGYWPIRSEIDPRPLLHAIASQGPKIGLPVVIEPGKMIFRRLETGKALVDAGFGTMAPGPDAEVLCPDLILLPLLAFDEQGRRLGYGGGFYDRFVAATQAAGMAPRLVGLAYGCQRVETVAVESHDIRLDAVLTEERLHRFG